MNCTVVNLLASISRTFNCLINEIRLLKYTMIPYYDMMFKKKQIIPCCSTTKDNLVFWMKDVWDHWNEVCLDVRQSIFDNLKETSWYEGIMFVCPLLLLEYSCRNHFTSPVYQKKKKNSCFSYTEPLIVLLRLLHFIKIFKLKLFLIFRICFQTSYHHIVTRKDKTNKLK